MPCCAVLCRVVSPEGTYTLQAESEYERAEWIASLQVGGWLAEPAEMGLRWGMQEDPPFPTSPHPPLGGGDRDSLA